jgi:hypothetical protein
MISRGLFYAFIAVFIAGCSLWARVDESTRMLERDSFVVELPMGWMRSEALNDKFPTTKGPVKGERVAITRDGLNLQQVDVMRLDAQNAFPNINKPLPPSALPFELAEMYVADMKAAGMEALTVVKSEPVLLGGEPAFLLHVRFRNNQGLQFERLVYGLGHARGLYLLSFQAPSLHYFPQYRDTFDSIVSTFKAKSAAQVVAATPTSR